MVKLPQVLSSTGFLTPKALVGKPSSHLLQYPILHYRRKALVNNPSRRNFASGYSNSKMGTEFFMFGPYKIQQKEVFYSTELSYAMVNLRPLLPGHVLVCPMRQVKRFVDLTAEETSDLWLAAKLVGGRLEHHYNASSLTFAIQILMQSIAFMGTLYQLLSIFHHTRDPMQHIAFKDGPQAGQTVPHVHIHILPRKGGDFEKNDEIYDAIDVKEKELKEKLDLDVERKDRTLEEMAQEAAELRVLFS